MIDTDMKLSRRTLIRTMVGAAGGMLVGFRIPGAFAAVVAPKPWTTPTEGDEINAWLAIDADGTVTIRVPHTEQGQGALTSVSMMIAEELDVPWESVQAVFADMNRHVNEGEEYIVTTTHGSQLVRQQHPHIMQAGASARERLKAAAAQAWGVERPDVVARQGMLSAGNRSASYAEFAGAAAEINTADSGTGDQSRRGEWWLLGKPTPRLDAAVKSNGSAHFSIDTRLEGMVYAAVKSCPVPWGRLESYDFDVVSDRAGVLAAVELKAVEGKTSASDMQNGVAVVADTWYRAKTALDLMPIEWEFGPEGEVSNETQAVEARRLLEETGEVSNEVGGDAIGMIAASDRTLTAEYHRPWETHARMEPINATVSVTGERVDVWSPAQNQAAPLAVVADQLGRDTRDVYVHTGFIGGAFGGKSGGADGLPAGGDLPPGGRRSSGWTREETSCRQAATRAYPACGFDWQQWPAGSILSQRASGSTTVAVRSIGRHGD